LAWIDLNLQPLGDDNFAALLVSPALQASATLALPSHLQELHLAWRRRFFVHHGGDAVSLPAHVVDDYSQQLIDGLRHWLQERSWSSLEQALRLQPGLPLRLRVAPSLRTLEHLPWETLPLDRPLWRLAPQDPTLSQAAPRHRRARLLLLVGQEEGLSLDTEVRALQELAERCGWHLQMLRGADSTAAGLRRALEAEPGWDVFIHLGHGIEDGQQGGRLQVGDGSWVSGASLELPMGKAANHGLRLILLNSCSGIDLAHSFLKAGVAWVQVFREPVPTRAAAECFIRLLRQLERGRSFPQAVLAAREILEGEAGCRGLLSVYCHPEATSYQWPRVNQRLKRREWLLLSGGALVAGSVVGSVAWDQRGRYGTTVWKMGNWMHGEKEGLLLAEAPKRLVKRLREITEGRFEIRLEQGKIDDAKILSRVNNSSNEDSLECGYANVYYNESIRPLYFFQSVPFGLTPREQYNWLGYVKKLTREGMPFDEWIYGKVKIDEIPLKDLISFPIACTGGQMGGWFKTKVTTIQQLNNLRFRIPGFAKKILENDPFNAITDFKGQMIRASDIPENMKRGRLDACEYTGPHDDMLLGLHKYARYYYYPGWWEPSATFHLYVNRNSYARLSEEHKQALASACDYTYHSILRDYDLKNMTKLAELRSENDPSKKGEIVAFDPAIMQEFRKRSDEYIGNEAGNDDVLKEVYDEWKLFRDRIRATLAVTQYTPPD
jgi:TRAP-type mannitol/chloroaromatic compound transport system substrate-binding protein